MSALDLRDGSFATSLSGTSRGKDTIKPAFVESATLTLVSPGGCLERDVNPRYLSRLFRWNNRDSFSHSVCSIRREFSVYIVAP